MTSRPDASEITADGTFLEAIAPAIRKLFVTVVLLESGALV